MPAIADEFLVLPALRPVNDGPVGETTEFSKKLRHRIGYSVVPTVAETEVRSEPPTVDRLAVQEAPTSSVRDEEEEPASWLASAAVASAAARGGTEQDVSSFDDFADFDFELPEDPDSGVESLADAKKPKRESPVRRFLFGPKNASRTDGEEEKKDDRDFDW